ncbi:MAG: NifU N-terminal domain-containing protein [Alphaproteobacteria bacterium]|nr:NifU N-terminal domain-containing protein [Alphaproteobacteria bacterium]
MKPVALLKLPFRMARAAFREARAASGLAPADPPPPPPAPAPEPAPEPAAPEPAPARPVQVRVEATPNPDALKFVCSSQVVARGSLAVNGPDEAAGHPFAELLIALDGVRTVFATRDFVTVSREPEGPGWEVLEPEIVRVLQATLRG